MPWFPLVGVLVGGVGAGVSFLATHGWSHPVASLLGLIAMVVMTGGLHLDGFSDTVDGLAAWRGPKETLRVMRDSRIGTLGAAGLILLLGLKWVLIQTIPIKGLASVLVVACALSRMCLVLSAQTFPYIPGESGLGRFATDHRSPLVLWTALALGMGVAIACVGPFRGLLCVGGATVITWGLNRFFLGRLGGITGDTLGAVNEVIEVSLLLYLQVVG